MRAEYITHPDLVIDRKANRQVEELDGLPLSKLVCTPDLHPGARTPIGVVALAPEHVIPALPGSDIGCGMQLHVTSLTRDDLSPQRLDLLQERLRARFFSGERQIRLNAEQRVAIIQQGSMGLLDTWQGDGLWQGRTLDETYIDVQAMHSQGSWSSTSSLFSGWTFSGGDGWDGQLGSVGGGNHFVELGWVSQICDGSQAWSWGVKPDLLAILVHTGSLGFGGNVWMNHGSKDVKPLAIDSTKGSAYINDMQAAMNIAAVNRLLLGRMAACALSDAVGEDQFSHRLVADTPHNWVDISTRGALHRKGATPALLNEPVLVPGSMGTTSWLLAGLGEERVLSSTAHGAGRAVARGRAGRDTNLQEESHKLRVVMPISAQDIRNQGRRDLLDIVQTRLGEEAPSAYKSIDAIVEATEKSGAAHRVAAFTPIMTVKGF